MLLIRHMAGVRAGESVFRHGDTVAHGLARVLAVVALGLVAVPAVPHTPRRETPALAYTFVNLGMLPGGMQGSFATGINAAGDVVGYSSVANKPDIFHAFLYTGGKLQDLARCRWH